MLADNLPTRYPLSLSPPSFQLTDQPLREALGNDSLYVLPKQLITPCELFLRLRVQRDDLPVRAHDHHCIRRSLQKIAIRSSVLAFVEIVTGFHIS
jgi:hypothetical protein